MMKKKFTWVLVIGCLLLWSCATVPICLKNYPSIRTNTTIVEQHLPYSCSNLDNCLT